MGVLQAAFDPPFDPFVLFCWPGVMVQKPSLRLARLSGGDAFRGRHSAGPCGGPRGGVVGMPGPALTGAGWGGLASLLHPPQLSPVLLGSGLPEQAANCRLWARVLPGREGGPGGDERAFVSLFVSRWESTSSHPAAPRYKGKGSPRWAGLQPAFFSFWHFPGAPLQPPASLGPPASKQALPRQTWVTEPWLNICQLRRALKAAR